MHEPAGVVEILVQILPEYAYSEFQNTPSPQMKIVSKIWEFQNKPPPNENVLQSKIREFQNTPPKWKLSESPNSLSFPECRCHPVECILVKIKWSKFD